MKTPALIFAPGDLVEVAIPGGFAYLQVTHRHPSYPEVVRALPGRYSNRQGDPMALAKAPARFFALFPLSEAVARGTIAGRKVGAAAIPVGEQAFPTFKIAIHGKPTGVRGDVAYWWFWDGETLKYDSALPGAEDPPDRKVLSADELIARLEGDASGIDAFQGLSAS